MQTSSLFSLNWQDAAKGLLMAVLGAVVSVIVATVKTGNFTFTWESLWHGAVVGGASYLTKNFLTPSQTIPPSNLLAK